MMLKKQKKLNNSSAFTLIELLIVIIIIGIIVSTISFNFTPNQLHLAADQLIKDIRYTQSLALKDDKYQPFPVENNATEYNRTKYWFKQWWQLRFSTFPLNGQTHYWYEIFSDQPYSTTHNFSAQANLPTKLWDVSIAKDPLTNKLLIGHCNAQKYPDCNATDTKLDLTKAYGIKKLEYINMYARSPRLVFDNYGNVFLREDSSDGDSGHINPLDEINRMQLTQNAKIKICLDNPCNNSPSRCIQVNISPNGMVWKSNCDN